MNDHDHRRLRREKMLAALFWVAVFVVGATSNVLADAIDAWRDGDPFDWLPPVINQGSSITMSLLLLPFLLTTIRRWPIQWDNWKRQLPLYLLGSIAWTLLHVGGMVALRMLAHAAMGDPYHYGPWASNLLYEYSKDARDFFVILAGVHAFDGFRRLRQGEAHALSAPDAGIVAVPESAVPERPQRFVVRKLNREFLIATDDIEWLQANGNYVNLHLGGKAYPLRATIGWIESQLDPVHFVRVHRSHIVNLRFVESIEPTESGDARIHLRDGTQVACSRRHRDALRPTP